MKRLTAVALAALSIASVARAAPTLDQSHVVDRSDFSTFGIGYASGPIAFGQYDALQTVTAGLTGKLTALDLQLLGPQTDPVEVSIIADVGIDSAGNITGTRSASVTIPTGSAPDTNQFYFDNKMLPTIDVSGLDVYLTSGETFGIYITDTAGIAWVLNGPDDTSDYAGGTGYVVHDGIATAEDRMFTSDPTDFGFQTFVDPALLPPPSAAVPEIGTWAMMMAGMGFTGASMRLRKRAVRFG